MDSGSPQPQAATNGAEFVAAMRQLRQWAHLSYRQLERRAQDAGDALPRATLAGALSRQELPREELLAAFVRACGGDEATVEAWIKARKCLAVDLEQPAALMSGQSEPGAGPNAATGQEPETGKEEETGQQREAGTVPGAEGPTPPAPSDERQEAGAAAEESGPDTVLKGRADTPGRRPAPAADEAAGNAVTAMAPAVVLTGETTGETDSRRRRRRALIATLSVVVVLLAAAVTGIALLPDGAPGPAKQVTPTKSPAVTTSASPAPSGTAKPATARPSGQRDVAETPSSKRTPRATPTLPPIEDPRPGPKPSSSEPTMPPYKPDPDPWEPPPSTPSSPPADTGDPFPEETCWDVTNDCP